MYLPSIYAMRDAGHDCYALAYQSECENRGIAIGGPGTCLCDCVPQLTDDVQLPIVFKYLVRIGAAWGHSVRKVFSLMGLPYDSELETKALRHLLLGCLGHGINLTDDFDDDFANACDELGTQLDPSPIYSEGTEWYHLASSHVDLAIAAGDLKAPEAATVTPTTDAAVVAAGTLPLPIFAGRGFLVAGGGHATWVGHAGAHLVARKTTDGDWKLFVSPVRHGIQCPIRHHTGDTVYDQPEFVPKYLKKAAKQEFDRARAYGQPYANDHLPCPHKQTQVLQPKAPATLWRPGVRALILG